MSNTNPGPASTLTPNQGGSAPATWVDQAGTQLRKPDGTAFQLISGPTRGQTLGNLQKKFRAALIGDSYLTFAGTNPTVATSAGKFVVSKGIATITATGNANVIAGDYVGLVIFVGDPNFTLALNGAYTQVLTVTSNSVFTVSATFGGRTMADGDYSNFGGSGWTFAPHNQGVDSSIYRWLNAFYRNPFVMVQNNSHVQQTSTVTLASMSQTFAGPPFDVAFISCGIVNDLGGGGGITLANALIAKENALYNCTQIINQIVAYGAICVVCLPPAMGSGVTNAVNKNIALSQFRTAILQIARQNSQVLVIDCFKDSIVGTSATGDVLPGFQLAATNDVHTSTFGLIFTAKNEAAAMAPFIAATDIQPTTILDDMQTTAQALTAWTAGTPFALPNAVTSKPNNYVLLQAGTSGTVAPSGTGQAIVDGGCIWAYVEPTNLNLLPHGMMDGTTGTNSTAATIPGNVPTGWTLTTTNGAPTGTVASAQTRLSVANTNTTSWGFGCNFNINWQAANDGIRMQSSDFSGQVIPGQWHQIGITATAISDFSNTTSIAIVCLFNSAAIAGQAQAMGGGNNTTTWPLKAGDVVEIHSDPFFIPVGWVAATGVLQIFMGSGAVVGGGNMNVQLSSAFLRPVPTSLSPNG
jgi:hypothetical protein